MSRNIKHLIPSFHVPYNDVFILSAGSEILIVFAVRECVHEIFMTFQRADRLSSFGIVDQDNGTIDGSCNEGPFWTADHCTNKSRDAKHTDQIIPFLHLRRGIRDRYFGVFFTELKYH